jgi:sec-independent protein translocase protein TatB
MDSFFGIGGPELLLILVLATVILGPLRMIQVARGLGRLLRDLRNYSTELMSGLNEELAFLDEAKEVLQEGVNAASLKPEEVQTIFPRLESGAPTDSSAPTQPQVDAVLPQPQESTSVSPGPEPNATISTSVEWKPLQANVSSTDQIPPSASPGLEGSIAVEPALANMVQASTDSVAPTPPTFISHESDATDEPDPTPPDPI